MPLLVCIRVIKLNKNCALTREWSLALVTDFAACEVSESTLAPLVSKLTGIQEAHVGASPISLIGISIIAFATERDSNFGCLLVTICRILSKKDDGKILMNKVVGLFQTVESHESKAFRLFYIFLVASSFSLEQSILVCLSRMIRMSSRLDRL